MPQFHWIFQENEPYHIVHNFNKFIIISMQWKPFSWNQRANYLMIDQTSGTELSFIDNNT